MLRHEGWTKDFIAFAVVGSQASVSETFLYVMSLPDVLASKTYANRPKDKEYVASAALDYGTSWDDVRNACYDLSLPRDSEEAGVDYRGFTCEDIWRRFCAWTG